MDLSGTTFWEFKDSLGSNRLRRIAQPDPKTHYSDVKVSRGSPIPRPSAPAHPRDAKPIS
jgi:hypothetical protein